MVFKNISHNRVLNIMGRLVDPQASVFITKELVVKYLPLVERYYAEGVGVILDGNGKKVPLSDLIDAKQEIEGKSSGDVGEKGVESKEEAGEAAANDAEDDGEGEAEQQPEPQPEQEPESEQAQDDGEGEAEQQPEPQPEQEPESEQAQDDGEGEAKKDAAKPKKGRSTARTRRKKKDEDEE